MFYLYKRLDTAVRSIPPWQNYLLTAFTITILIFFASDVLAHGVPQGDKAYIQESTGVLFLPFVYLGAKHMITGYDHLLFLFGVIFFLYRLRDVSIYVTLFAVGHSVTMLVGVIYGISMNAYVVDAIIALSVIYKALDNMGVYKRLFDVQPDTKAATLLFGLVHGFGLATKLQEFEIAPDGLFQNLVAFNIGVELGQLLALAGILILMGFWRRSSRFVVQAIAINISVAIAGLYLFGHQVSNLMSS